MKIDCGRCEMRGTGCQDCVITALEPRNAGAPRPGYLGEAEVRALGVLAAAGMVPPLRFSLPGFPVRSGSQAWTRRSFPDTKAS